MGLTQALATSLSGLNATQTGLSVVAGNVANAQTPGYVAQTRNADRGAGRQRRQRRSRYRDQPPARHVRSTAVMDGKRPAAPTPTSTPISISNCSKFTASRAPAPLSIRFSTISPAPCRLCRPAQFVRGAKPDHQLPRRLWRSNSTARPPASSRCAVRPTRASPTTCSRPTTPCSRSPPSISNCDRQLARRQLRRPRSRTSAINISTNCRI